MRRAKHDRSLVIPAHPHAEIGEAMIQRQLAEHTQRWSRITWPLIPWPAWCARAYYNLPAGAAWIARGNGGVPQNISFTALRA